MSFSFFSDPKVLVACIATMASLAVALASGVWSVWVRAQENRRAKWKRVEDLMQIIHNGAARGLWAQKLAVVEMTAIAGRDKNVVAVLTEAAIYFKSAGSIELGNYIVKAVAKL